MSTSPPPILVVDIDGVLGDFTFSYKRWAQGSGGGRIHGAGGQQDWYLISRDDFWERVQRNPAEAETFFGLMPSLVTSADVFALHRAALSHEIVYVTDRFEWLRPLTERWIAQQLLPFGTIHMSDTHLPPKAEFLAGAEWRDRIKGIIDDKPKVIEALFAAKMPITVRDWPYNRMGRPDIPRVSSVEEWVWKTIA